MSFIVLIILVFMIRYAFSTFGNLRNSFKTEEATTVCGLQIGSPWPMFGRNPYHNGNSPFTGPGNNSLRWSYRTGATVTSAVLSVDGTIYTASSGDGSLFAINSDGSLKWKFRNGIKLTLEYSL